MLKTTAGFIRVWDFPLRLFHWLLVLSVASAAITGYLLPVTWLQVHLIAGTVIGVLVLVRIVWGFTGSWFSRFRSFVFSPATTIAHVKDVIAGRVHREAGHNPVGALMVFALLICITVIVATGVATLGGVFKQGPVRAFMSFANGMLARDVHSLFAIVLLALIGGHLMGVIFESHRSKENLTRAMVTGGKRGGFAQAIPVVKARYGAALSVAALLGAVLAPGAFILTGLAPSGAAAIPLNVAWQRECGECHMAFHPSLLPAKSWVAIMANLGDHFGEDASLDAVKANEISDFLTHHSAETWDSLAANRLRFVDAARPMEITATQFWTRMHHDIPAEVFARKTVGAKQNCSACHADAASGMFAPQDISIPQEKTE